MIVKTISRKDSSFGAMLAYIARPDAAQVHAGKIISFRHNVYGSLGEIARQFKDNHAKRLHPRKNATVMKHSVLSFLAEDAKLLDEKAWKAMFDEFVRLSGDNSLYYAAVHGNTQHPHMHILGGGSDMMGRSTRLSKAQYRELKIYMQKMQEREYPELKSLVNHEQSKTKIGKQKLSREEVSELVNASFALANSRQEFFDLIKQEDKLTMYERGGEFKGIDEEGHMRFSNLGIDLGELDKRQSRLQELEEVSGLPMKEPEQSIDESQRPPVEKSNELER